MGLRENLFLDGITQLSLREPLSVPPETSIRQTVQFMREAGVGYCLICRDGELTGIFTERDLMKRVLVRRVDPAEPVEAYMTPDPVTVRRSDSVAAAIRIMFQGHYRHLPVLDEAGVAIGVASVKHIVAYLVDYYPSTVYNLPPQPRQVQTSREGA